MNYNTRIKFVGKDQYNKIQDALFSMGYTWASGDTCRLYESYYTGEGALALKIEDKSFLRTTHFGNTTWDNLPFIDVELKPVVKYSLVPVKVRETVAIGKKTYYLDELEVALKNIKPIAS